MNIAHVLTKSGKNIHVFDGVTPLRFRENAYQTFLKSYFIIGWSDTEDPAKKVHDHFLHSNYSYDDVVDLGLFEVINAVDGIKKLIEGLHWQKTILNLSQTSDVNYIHSHPEKKVVLYYGNVEWRDGAHGETHFYNDNLTDIEFTSSYVPGRIIVFDGDIPHCIRPQSIIGPKFRFTLATTFHDKPRKI